MINRRALRARIRQAAETDQCLSVSDLRAILALLAKACNATAEHRREYEILRSDPPRLVLRSGVLLVLRDMRWIAYRISFGLSGEGDVMREWHIEMSWEGLL